MNETISDTPAASTSTSGTIAAQSSVVVSATVPAATEAPKIRQLSASWQDWLTTNVMRGCSEADMTRIMVENGFEPVFAGHAIGIIRSMTERVQSKMPGALVDYKPDPIRLPSQARIRAHDRDVRIAAMLLNPNIAVIDGLLSEAECDKLVQMTNGRMKSSQVVDRESGGSYESNVRRSEGCHFNRGENALVQRIEQRIQALTGIPVDHGEPLQMLHYGIGGEYLAHQDFFDPKDAGTAVLTRVGGQRVATVVMYLNDVPEGGATDFPELEFSVKAKKGSAVYFEYRNGAGDLDTRCLHAGMPVVRGDKWIVTKWLRERPYVGS